MSRLDEIVAEQNAMSRSQARSLIMEGRVLVDGNPATKPGTNVRANAIIEIERPRRYVSRGGEKLDHALNEFDISVLGMSALDIGASTGGFTDCLLQRGAAHVVAVDVGYGQLDWGLRNDPRIKVMERTNFRNLSDDAFAEPFDLVVIDASFISLRTIVARAVHFLADGGTIVALVKPQFEAGPQRLGRGGVVRDPAVHRAVLRETRDALGEIGLKATALVASPLRGPAGNREFFMRLMRTGTNITNERIDEVVA
ncbi:MAG TPA: TlyA family RNA methyltransferase [Candidatus Rubrimentiphilum sp.]|nr:TlyA family RNA methyltransferase [Candidatus Rubrimentiphilum sp.]